MDHFTNEGFSPDHIAPTTAIQEVVETAAPTTAIQEVVETAEMPTQILHKEYQMDNVFDSGAGLGAGLVGGVVGGALLGNNGILGGNRGNVEGLVTPTLLNSSIAQVQDAAVATTQANAFREIQAAIERTSAATQLAGQVAATTLGIASAKGFGEVNTQNALNAAAIQTQSAKQAGDLSTQVALNTAAVATAVERTGTATALAFKDAALLTQNSTSQILMGINNDGERTRALIVSQYEATLNRQLSDANNLIAELRNDGRGRDRSRETEVTVTQTVNQAQAQQQQQQQAIINERICAALHGLQVATATNSNLIIGNAGATTTGAQTANPINVGA